MIVTQKGTNPTEIHPARASILPYTKNTSTPLPTSTPTQIQAINQLKINQDIWDLNSVDFPDYISALGLVFHPPTQKDPFPSYVFLRLNFQCTTGKSLIHQYSGLDMGVNFVHKQTGYPDVSIEDLQGHKYLVTLMGGCWLAAPIPRSRAKDGYYTLNFRNYPPFLFSTQNISQNFTKDICFISDLDGTKEVFKSSPNAGNITRLTTEFSRTAEPSWSTDHEKIAFVSNRNGNGDISVMTREGIKLLTLDISPADEGGPVWSPDDKQIAFHTNRDGNWEIYKINLLDNWRVNLTREPADDKYPHWSPDGKQIAFQTARDGNWEIYVMDSDGSQPLRLTDNPADDILPSWSPDGARILFWSQRSGIWKLMQMDRFGRNLKSLTSFENPGPQPSRAVWSPDGQKILLTLVREGFLQLFTMNADGSEITRLAKTPANFFTPDW